jgi:hypothetical protein
MGEDEVCRMDKRPSTADWRTVGGDNTLWLGHLTTGNALQRWGRIRCDDARQLAVWLRDRHRDPQTKMLTTKDQPPECASDGTIECYRLDLFCAVSSPLSH